MNSLHEPVLTDVQVSVQQKVSNIKDAHEDWPYQVLDHNIIRLIINVLVCA